MSEYVYVMDVWGGPDCAANVWWCRRVCSLENVGEWVAHELSQGYIVNSARVSRESASEMPEFDHRVEGSA